MTTNSPLQSFTRTSAGIGAGAGAGAGAVTGTALVCTKTDKMVEEYKKRKPKLVSFYNDLYYFRFYLALFCSKLSQVETLLHKAELLCKDAHLEESHGDAVTYFLNENALIVPFDLDSVIDIGLLVHEAVHVANYMCARIGIKLCSDNDEPYAYMVQWLVNKLLDQEDIATFVKMGL